MGNIKRDGRILEHNSYVGKRNVQARIGKVIALAIVALCACTEVKAAEIDQGRLADAIFHAEGIHSRHPYGILAKYKHTTPRQACLNTIASSMRRWEAAGRPGAFIPWLAKTYCPVGSDTDDGTCRYWPGNVEALYHG